MVHTGSQSLWSPFYENEVYTDGLEKRLPAILSLIYFQL